MAWWQKGGGEVMESGREESLGKRDGKEREKGRKVGGRGE